MVKKILAALFGFSLCFAQTVPPKLAVYVSGAENAGVNRSLSVKLLAAMTQGGSYSEIADPALFQDEVARSGKSDIASIAQAAQRRGADYVCVVGMTEAFGAYSITARLTGVSDLQSVKTASVDHSLKSMDDLTAVSSLLARQFLPKGSFVASPQPSSPPPVAVDAEAPSPPVAATGECARKYNVNELLYKVKNGFPSKLKDCSGTLAKDMLTPASFGGHKLVPAQFMTQCPVDAIKKELPDGFPGVDKFLAKLTNFVQTLMNSAMAGGSLDPKKLISVVGSMDINGLLDEVKKLSEDPCVVDEPYEPPTASEDDKEEESEEKESKISFGIRAGVNFSHTYAKYTVPSYIGPFTMSGAGDYGDILGMQAGFVVDFPVVGVFHIQPGLMYIQRGMENSNGKELTSHNLELPLLLSFKLAALRLNVGPYFGLCVTDDNGIFNEFGVLDMGLSTGIGFDIGKFYIGAFYDYGITDVSSEGGYSFYNRTLGFNLGINL